MLWLTVHASRLKPFDGESSNCIIETWRTKAHEIGERALENLRDGVTEALRQIGNGFLQHPENDDLRSKLEDSRLSPVDYFRQLLGLVYRLIFLFATEERDLLHEPDATIEQKSIFAEGYSLNRLRERALRRRYYDHYKDIWINLQITFRALARGATALGIPALGGLFRDRQCPDLDNSSIANERILDGVHSLSFFRSDKSLARVNYRDMGTEELGSVYESLLELQPVVDVNTTPWIFCFVSEKNVGKTRGSERKLTGSYYTPSSLVSELIKSTLEPVLARAVADRPEAPRMAILELKVLDPACGSGHFLLAATRRMAAEIARIESGTETPDESARQHALREVVQHCIHGVDRNPLAVELCKTALWIETMEPGMPLTFLESHIQLGDSLVGILDPEILANGIPGGAYKSLTGDDKAICRDLTKRNRLAGKSVQGNLFDQDSLSEIVKTSVNLDRMPEETLDDVERKRVTWEAIRLDKIRQSEELRANLFVGAYFAKKTSDTITEVPLTEDLNRLRMGLSLRSGVEVAVTNLASQHYFLHWHLAFAEIMKRGGFDVVFANPPWEVSQLSEEEYFAVRAPSIANLSGEERKRVISQLKKLDPPLWRQYQLEKHKYNARNAFCRSSSRYLFAAYGKLNSYSLFIETFLQLLSPNGQVGLIVPSGIATDHSKKDLFVAMLTKKRLISLYDFENRDAVFTGVHRSYKFCLLTLSSLPSTRGEFAFFLYRTEQLRDSKRRFTLSADDFALFNPNTRTCPIFRTRRDMEIARKMYRHSGIFWKESTAVEAELNPWGGMFMQMFNMTSDSGLFRTYEWLEGEGWQLRDNVFVRGKKRYLPLYEAKLFHQYDHRFATFDGVSDADIKKGNARTMTSKEKTDPRKVVIPRYWVPEVEVSKRLDRRETDRTTDNHSLNVLAQVARESLAARSREIRTVGFIHNELSLQLTRPCHDNQGISVNHEAPLPIARLVEWFQVFRNITNATNERSMITDIIPRSAVGHSATLMDYCVKERALASALILANMNSLPLDWAARISVGGVNMSFFIVKQLPVLPPEAYMGEVYPGLKYAEFIVPRVLELTYTTRELKGFARDLGYDGPPFPGDERRRHHLKCELDAIYAHMYQLERTEVEWILDAPSPSLSFPALKRNEIKEFGEFRTQRYVLQAYDQLERNEIPHLGNQPC